MAVSVHSDVSIKDKISEVKFLKKKDIMLQL